MKPHRTHTPFAGIEQVATPSHLEERIYVRIAALEKRNFIVRVSTSVSLVVASLAGLVASCMYVWTTATSSGFGQYLSIIFSDSGAALSNFKEFGLALVESSPIMGVALALVATVAVGWSVAQLSQLSRGLIKNDTSHAYAL